ncbi:MAG: Curli production assembly/transport component CsgG [Fibrobacteres bacterium]|nr:Curli production assembly/transport component CsgG [Fibrobacterota bacterium]
MRLTILLLILICRLSPSASAAAAPVAAVPAASIAGAPASAAETAGAKKETLLAVMDILNNTGEFQSFVDGMPDMLITELLETGDVKLVERTKVQTAMKALKLETSGLTQERNLELGKWLGVDGILFGAFNRVGDKYRLDVRAIDVQTGKINVAASATCGKQNIPDMIPDIGKQLRVKLSSALPGKESGQTYSQPVAPSASKPAADSCPLEIQYKMMVSLLAETGIPHQRVRIYLDNNLLGVSGVVDDLNRYFILYKGNIAAGNHVLSLVHGSVDRQGRWVRELGNQPEPYSFYARKDDRPAIQYKMHAHEGWFSFKDFTLNYHNHNDGE